MAIDKSSINDSLRHLGGVCDNSVGLSCSGKTNSTVAAFILSPHIVGLPTLLFRIFVNVFFSQHRARKSYKLGPFRTSHTSRLTLTQVKIRLHFVSFNCSISLFNFYCPISSYLPCLLQLRVFIQSRFLFTFQINVSSFPLLNFVRISVPTSISTSQFRLHYSVCSICFPFLSQFSPTCQFFCNSCRQVVPSIFLPFRSTYRFPTWFHIDRDLLILGVLFPVSAKHFFCFFRVEVPIFVLLFSYQLYQSLQFNFQFAKSNFVLPTQIFFFLFLPR